jgi:hypothetical protein
MRSIQKSSNWVTHQGLADAGRSDHALELKKLGTTVTNASSGADVHGVIGLTLSELGFDYEVGGHCGAGAPRFNVTLTTGQTFFFGCSHGDVVGTLTDRQWGPVEPGAVHHRGCVSRRRCVDVARVRTRPGSELGHRVR